MKIKPGLITKAAFAFLPSLFLLLFWTNPLYAYEIRSVDRFTLQPAAVANKFELLLEVESGAGVERFTVQLEKSEMFTDYQVHGKDVVPAIDVYSGRLVGYDNSWARITIAGQVLFGLIDTGNTRYEISTEKNVLPTALNLPGSRRAKTDRHGVVNALSSGKPFSRVLPVAIVIDHLYDEKYAGNGLPHAISIVNGVDGIFRQELGMAVKLEVAISVESESFSSLPGASPSQLYSFRQFRQSQPELQGNVALVHLFSGSDLPPFSYAGVGYAYIGTACENTGFDISVSSPYYLGTELTAHEMAHNLGAFHDEDTDACSDDTSHLMYSVVGGATQLSACSLDQIEATLQQRSCYSEVHDGSVWLEQSGARSVIVHVSSASVFDTVISPEVQFTFAGRIKSMPAYCHTLGSDTVNCTLPAIVPNEDYQFALEFQPGSTMTVFAEYLEADAHDQDMSNNIGEVTLYENGWLAPVKLCVDVDGDGYGWDGTDSCVPVPADLPPETVPEYVNRTTGETIHLTDERWAVSDIADRVIECHAYFYDSVQNQYTPDDSSYTRYRHTLDAGNAAGGAVEVAHFVSGSESGGSASSIEYRSWNLQQGYYSGPAAFSRSSFLQIVSAGGGSNNAVRSYSSDLSFDLCTAYPDVSQSFRPTGSVDDYLACIDTVPLNDGWGWNGINPCRLSIDSSLPAIVSPAVVIGSAAGMITLDGNIDADEWRTASTQDVQSSPLSLPVAIAGLRSSRDNDSWMVMHDRSFVYLAVFVPDNTPFRDSAFYQHDDSIELFFDGGNQRSRLYDSDDSHFIFRRTGEVTGTFIPGARAAHVRRYDAAAKQYVYEIQISKRSLQILGHEFGLDLQVNNDQDGGERDSKWGWSGNTGSNTHWYELATVGSACFDTAPLSGRCAGDPVQVPEPVCVDSYPLGDGWGWNGQASCRLSKCIDTGVVGDGWGWDGTASCRLEITASPGACVESGVAGDGWGWNGVASCRM